MTATVQSNGQARKTLSAQIDRLDTMLDGLAEGIQETVVSAVQQAVVQAVREAVLAAVTQVLTNPDLQRHLRPEPAASTAVPEPVLSPVVSTARRAGGWLTRLASGVGHAVKTVLQVTANTLCGAARGSVTVVLGAGQRGYRFLKTLLLAGWQRLKSVCRKAKELCSPVLLSLWVGLVLGVFTFAAGPFLASLISGLIGQLLVLSALVIQPLRRWIEISPDGGAE